MIEWGRGGAQRSFCDSMRGNDCYCDAAPGGMLVYESNLRNIMAAKQCVEGAMPLR